MATAVAQNDRQPALDRIQRLTHQSSLRERVFENLLLGLLGIELLERSIEFTVLHPTSDREGYDVVIEHGPVIRHIQLKATVTGSATRTVPVNTRLAARSSGCVIWMVFDPASRTFAEYRWFGGAPGMPLPHPGDRPVRHSRGNRDGVKAIRPEIRALALNRFERLTTIGELAYRLFGTADIDRPARRCDGQAQPCPDQRAYFERPIPLTRDQEALIRRGLVPKGSDDRWFLFVEDDQLFCHRSWTGACIFGAHIESDAIGGRLNRCWVSRDADAYQSSGIDADRHEFEALLCSHLLDRRG